MPFVIEVLSTPMQSRIVQGAHVFLTGKELRFAGAKVRESIDGLAGINGVADGGFVRGHGD